MKDNLELARAAGLTVLLDGKIGREDYHSISGSLAALVKFAQLYAAEPIDMVLYCPKCGTQHIDKPADPKCCGDRAVGAEYMGQQEKVCCGNPEPPEWTNPPHRSHLCASCGTIWRPADVPTNGVSAIKTTGKRDYVRRSPAAPATDYEALEREHFGDPDKRTGIYAWKDTGPLETGE